ncbi:MAG TPA: ABC transporter permease [Negativicutes bacterium]|nr:ABC transporter permease [Negativicutes bacterium]
MRFVRSLIHELRYTLRSKDVIIMLLLGPVVLTILFGGTYINTYVNDIPVVILDEDNSSLSRAINMHFNENDRFRVAAIVDSIEEAEEMVGSEQAFMGVCIPKNFNEDVLRGASPQVLVLVDGANIVIGNSAYSTATNIIQTIAAGAEIKRLEAKGVLPGTAYSMANPFMFTDRMLYNPKLSYLNYLLLGYIAVFFQQVMLSGVGLQMIKDSASIAGWGTARAALLKVLACAFYAILSVAAAIGAAAWIFHVSIRGNVLTALCFCLLFAFAISGPAIMIASLTKDKMKYMQISYMLSLPTFISCGYIWPMDQMPKALVVLLKCVWPLINFDRPFGELLLKGIFPRQGIIGLAIYAMFWLPVSILFFNHRFGKCRKLSGTPAVPAE